MKRIIFISSIGGHLEQLLKLKKIIEENDSTLITEKNKSSIFLKEKYEKIYFLPYLLRKNYFRFVFNFLIIFFKSIIFFLKTKPEIIITTGSACCIPMCLIGKLFGSKIIFIETFSRINSKTMTGSLCYHFADIFIVQWEELIEQYPKSQYLGHIY